MSQQITTAPVKEMVTILKMQTKSKVLLQVKSRNGYFIFDEFAHPSLMIQDNKIGITIWTEVLKCHLQ